MFQIDKMRRCGCSFTTGMKTDTHYQKKKKNLFLTVPAKWLRNIHVILFYVRMVCKYIDILISKIKLAHVTLTYQILLRIF